MKKIPTHRPGPRLHRMALATAMAMAAPLAAAQTAEADKGTVITVTGVRKAVETAQTIKRESDQVVDAIVADDIGKFPDKNVAEILGRVTGVQTVRDSGEAGQVIVRGLGGIVTLLNGREIFTATGRSLFMADVPATMLKQIDVYKTQGAEFVEGGTAGVIDVRTNRPLDFKGRELSVALKGEYRDKAKSTNPDISGMYSDRWTTGYGEFGALLGLSFQRGKYQDETAWVSPPIPVDRALHTVDGVTGGTGTVTGFDAMGRVMNVGDRRRDAANFALQWRPQADLEVYAEGFKTLIKHDSESDFFVGALPWWNGGATITTIPGTNNIGSLTHPAADNFTLASTQARRDRSEGEQYALGTRWDATSALRLSGEYVHTKSKYSRANPIMDSVWFAPKAVEATVVNGGGYLNYPNGGVTDAANWKIFAFFDNHQRDDSHANDVRADASYVLDGGFFKELIGGVRLNRRTAEHINNVDGFTSTPGALQVPLSSVEGLACLSRPTGGDYGFKQFATPCRDFLLNHTAQARELATGSSVAKPDDPLSYYKDVETTTAVYLKTKFGLTLGGVPIDGTGGVRVVRTEQDLTGFASVNGVPSATPFNTVTTGTDALPSLSLKATLDPKLIARVVAGKAIQRPNFADFNPGLRLYPSNGNTTLSVGNAGNPDLKPIESKNLDATLEWYFAPTGSLTGTVFRHDFSNFLLFKGLPETYDGITYTVTRPYNAQDGRLQGFELAYRQFYDGLPGWMSGLGLEANFTMMKGGLTDPTTGKTNQFPGMSKTAYNLVGLYEKNGWYGRLAYNWRSKFVAESNYRATGLDLVVDPLRWLDASIGYNFSPNLTVGLDANNILDQDYHDYHGEPNQPRDVRRYDRTFGLSLRWKL
ncbi:TonB-dependent receptor [Ideonella sp.]|uniref:TonB-dependent receptor n=1 Tax=Ideonella sp. TaxID=1929293 RepID=UPI003BB6FC27